MPFQNKLPRAIVTDFLESSFVLWEKVPFLGDSYLSIIFLHKLSIHYMGQWF